jgi:hypothetical protein
MNGIMLFDWVAEFRPELARRFLFLTGDTHDPELPPASSEQRARA